MPIARYLGAESHIFGAAPLAVLPHLGGMRDHRSLEAWIEASSVAKSCFLLARDSWKPWCAALYSQLQRSALSVQLNITEGYAFGPGGNCARHYAIAYASAMETGDLLDMLDAVEAAPLGALRAIIHRNRRCQRLVLGLLKRSRE